MNPPLRSSSTESVDAQAALDRLPPRLRKEVLLNVNEELTCVQIAMRLGMPYRQVLRDLTRAYATLNAKLGLPRQR